MTNCTFFKKAENYRDLAAARLENAGDRYCCYPERKRYRRHYRVGLAIGNYYDEEG